MRKLIPFVFALAPALVLAASPFADAISAQQLMSKLAERFNQADADHDGKLTLDEAKAGMPRVAQHFDEIDADHRGYVTLDQIASYIASKRGGG